MPGSARPGSRLRARQRAFREEQILAETRRVLCRKTCLTLTVEEVAEALGTSKAAIYRHFRSREALLAQSLAAGWSATLERLRTALQGRVGDRAGTAVARALAEAWLRVGADDAALCCLCLVTCPFVSLRPVEELVRGAIPDAHSPWMPPDRFVAVLRALCAVTLARARQEGREPGAEDVDAVLADLFGRPLPSGSDQPR